VKQPLYLGGLDIRDLHLFNEALLSKWLWRFMNEKGNLWRKVATIKYGDDGFGWFPSIMKGSYVCSLWRYISKGWGRSFPHCSFEVGDGSLIFFWHDRWCGEIPLKDRFPRLYVLAVDKNASVANYQEQVYGNNTWAPVFVRDGFVDDDSLVSFFNKLNEANIGESSMDRVRWDLSTQGCFTVRSFYLKLLGGKFSPQKVHSEKVFLCKLMGSL